MKYIVNIFVLTLFIAQNFRRGLIIAISHAGNFGIMPGGYVLVLTAQ